MHSCERPQTPPMYRPELDVVVPPHRLPTLLRRGIGPIASTHGYSV